MEAALASVLVHGVTRENPVLDQSFIETAPKILRFFLLSNLGFSYMLFISMAFPSELTAFFTSLVNFEFLIIFPESYAWFRCHPNWRLKVKMLGL
jgi:hypothetical protein